MRIDDALLSLMNATANLETPQSKTLIPSPILPLAKTSELSQSDLRAISSAIADYPEAVLLEELPAGQEICPATPASLVPPEEACASVPPKSYERLTPIALRLGHQVSLQVKRAESTELILDFKGLQLEVRNPPALDLGRVLSAEIVELFPQPTLRLGTSGPPPEMPLPLLEFDLALLSRAISRKENLPAALKPGDQLFNVPMPPVPKAGARLEPQPKEWKPDLAPKVSEPQEGMKSQATIPDSIPKTVIQASSYKTPPPIPQVTAGERVLARVLQRVSPERILMDINGVRVQAVADPSIKPGMDLPLRVEQAQPKLVLRMTQPPPIVQAELDVTGAKPLLRLSLPAIPWPSELLSPPTMNSLPLMPGLPPESAADTAGPPIKTIDSLPPLPAAAPAASPAAISQPQTTASSTSFMQPPAAESAASLAAINPVEKLLKISAPVMPAGASNVPPVAAPTVAEARIVFPAGLPILITMDTAADVELVEAAFSPSANAALVQNPELRAAIEKMAGDITTSRQSAQPLQVGDRLQGRVLERISPERILVDLGIGLAECEAPEDLRPGAVLQLRVEQADRDLVLRLVETPPRMVQDLKTILLERLPHLDQSEKSIEAFVAKILQPYDPANKMPLPGSLKHLQSWISEWTAPHTAPAAERVAKAIVDGGLFYEAKLARLAGGDPQQMPALAQNDLKGLLLGSLKEIEQLPNRSELGTLSVALSSQTGRVEAKQALNLLAQVQDQPFRLDLPFSFGSQISNAHIVIDQDRGSGNQSRPGRRQGFNVLFLFDLEGLGKTRVDAYIAKGAVRAFFFVEEHGAIQLLESELAGLRETLNQMGYRDVVLEARDLSGLSPESRKNFDSIMPDLPSGMNLINYKA